MPEDTHSGDPTSQLLDEALAAYLELEEQGQAPDPERFVEANPAVAHQLRAYFLNCKRLHRAAGLDRTPFTALLTDGDATVRYDHEAALGSEESATRTQIGLLPVGADLRPGDHFAGHEILGELGRGGMGVVYKARQLTPRRLVALKVIRADRLEALSDAERAIWLMRFRDEAEKIAVLDHPSVVSLLEFGIAEGRPYFSMKLVEGGNLAQKRVSDCRRAARLVAQIARAIQHAHERGILHRDLKPHNILLDENGESLVTDFGLAKRLDEGAAMPSCIVGTVSYMAPEQAAGHRVLTTAVDVYGLGAVLYECLTGKAPFKGENDLETLRLVREANPVAPRQHRPDIATGLEVICLTCLRKEPTARYASAQALADDLDNWLAGRPLNARPAGWLEHAWSWCRRNPVPAVAAAVVLITTVVAFALISQSRAEAVARAASEQTQKEANARLAEDYRQLAGENRTLADSERGQKLAVQRELARLAFHEARRLASDYDEVRQGLPWFAYALERARAAEAGELERTVRTHLGVWSRSLTPLRAILIHGTPMAQGGVGLRALAFSPDSTLLATACTDGAVRLWNVHTGQRVGPLFGQAHSRKSSRLASLDRHPSEEAMIELPEDHDVLLRVVFSPDGKLLATGSMRGWVRLYEVASGKLLRSRQHHDWTKPKIYRSATGALYSQGGIEVLLFNPDGSLLLSAGRDHTAQLWEVATGRRRAVLRHPASVRAAAFHPDGSLLVTGCGIGYKGMGAAQLWDGITGAPRGEPLTRDEVAAVAFSPDGQYVLTGGACEESSRKGRAQFWHTATGKPAGQDLTFDSTVRAVAFCPEGRHFVAAAGNGSFQVIDRIRRKGHGRRHPSVEVPGEAGNDNVRILHIAFCPDARTFLTAGVGVQAFETVDGSPVGKPLVHDGFVHAVAVSPDGRTVATAGNDGTARLWEVPTRQPPASRSVKLTSPISRVAFNEKRKELVATTVDGHVGRYDADTGQLRRRWRAHDGILATLAIHPDGTRALTGGYDRVAWLWDLRTGRAIGAPWPMPGRVIDLAFSGDGRRAVLACDGFAKEGAAAVVWDVAAGKQLALLRHARKVWSAAFSPDGRTVVTACADGVARLWDVGTGKTVGSAMQHDAEVRVVAFHADGRTILTASMDGTARLWLAPTGKPHAVPMKHRGGVVAASFSPDGRRVLTASLDTTAQVWDVRTGQPAAPALVHHAQVRLATFSPDGTAVLTGCADGEARLWDSGSGLPLGVTLVHQRALTTLAFRGDGRMLITGGDDNQMRLRPVPRPIDGSLDRVLLAVRCLTGRQRDQDNAVRGLSAAEWQASLDTRRATRNDLLAADSIADWHQREAEECEATELWFSALWHLERLLEASPDDGKLLARAGLAQARLGRDEAAIALLGRALRRGGDWRVLQERGQANARLGRWDRAEADLQEAARRGKEAWEAHQALGELYAGRNRWKEAAATFGRAAALPEASLAVRVGHLFALLQAGDGAGYQKAGQALLDRLRRLRNREDRRQEAASVLWACALPAVPVGNPSHLANIARWANEEEPLRWYPFARALGACLLRAGRYPVAIEVLEHAAELQREAPATWLLLALAYQRQGDGAKARRWFDRAESWCREQKRDLPDWQERLALERLRGEASQVLGK